MIKITPFECLGTLGCNSVCGYLDDLWQFFFVIVIHESLCSEQLNWALFFRKILHVLKILQFSSIISIFEPFPALNVWFWDPSFPNLWTIEGLTFTDAPEESTMH